MPRHWRIDSDLRATNMPVQRFRSVEDMPPPWRDVDDPGNLRRVAMMLTLHQRLVPRPIAGVRRFRTLEEANADGGDVLRQKE